MNMSQTNTSEEESIQEGEIDFSKLSDLEKDDLILEMQAEEMMQKREAEKEVMKKKKKRRKQKSPSNANIAPGFGWVAIKMGSAMTFSLTFIFLGPLLIVMALLKAFADRNVYDWLDLLWGCVGIVLTIAAYFLFRYIIKD